MSKSKQKMTKQMKKLNKTQKDGLNIPFKKRIYICWYLYVQFLDDKKGIYKDWKVKKGEKFDLWWDKNWKRLFSEPIRGIKKISSIPKTKTGKESIFLEVPINKTQGDLISEFEILIRNEYKERGINKQKVFDSEGKWVPSVSHQFEFSVYKDNLECLKRYKKVNPKTGKIYTRNEIGLELKIHPVGEKCNRETIISRHVRNGLKTLEWVKKGQFK